jgi:uncharacterized protein (DUF2384 family)
MPMTVVPRWLTGLAEQAFGDAEEAREWLSAPHPMLGEQPPALIATEAGGRRVERLLLNIRHDLPA